MPEITPCLWYDGNAQEAAEFYVSIFPNSKITEITHYTNAVPNRRGQVMTVSFELDGRSFLGLNGGDAFKFSEAVSFQIYCDTQEEVDHYWNRLSEGGKEAPCGWLKDRYGLSWQVTPRILMRLNAGSDPAKSERAMRAMFTMKKIDIAAIEAAVAAP